MNVVLSESAWDDYASWQNSDRSKAERINQLIKAIKRDPFSGLGKPEPLRGGLSGFWSRRINKEHRLVYRVEGKGEKQQLYIIQCRYHY